MSYEHLTPHEQRVIHDSVNSGMSVRRIAERINRSPGTISRELKRNRCPTTNTYHPDIAQQQAQQRRVKANQRYKINRHRQLGQYIRDKLALDWSPNAIAGRLKIDYPDQPDMHVTHECIYQWIYREWASALCGFYLRLHSKHKKRKKRRPRCETIKQGIPGRVGIEHRPAVVSDRQEVGDWEADLVEGKKGRGVLLTVQERCSRLGFVVPLKNKNATRTCQALSTVLNQVIALGDPRAARTLTLDNGGEFTEHQRVSSDTGVSVYFSHPRSPQERGSNEQFNGLLRRYFPKGCDLRRVRKDEIAKAVKLINNKPRKILNYMTPAEVFSQAAGIDLKLLE